MRISEIYLSIQGESTYAGLPCVFVRTAGCSLRCDYCDTDYALSFKAGDEMSVETVLERVREMSVDLVEITGGEPLEDPDTPTLCQALLDRGATVLVETSGAFPIEILPAGVIRIMDLKTPSIRMQRRNRWENLAHLTERDEVKFVIGSREDFEWAAAICREHRLCERCAVLFSPVFGKIEPLHLTQWILAERLPVRFQLQLHKYVWSPDARGV